MTSERAALIIALCNDALLYARVGVITWVYTSKHRPGGQVLPNLRRRLIPDLLWLPSILGSRLRRLCHMMVPSKIGNHSDRDRLGERCELLRTPNTSGSGCQSIPSRFQVRVNASPPLTVKVRRHSPCRSMNHISSE